MVKRKILKKNKNTIILSVIIGILLLTNIYTICRNNKETKEVIIKEEILFKETNKDFNKKTKYYATVSYNKFINLLNNESISTIAIVDNSSKTYNKFIEMVNKLSYYKNTKIYLLEISKLSKKNEIKFYETDERLKELTTNYIITVSNHKIVSITTFDNTELYNIIEGIGE